MFDIRADLRDFARRYAFLADAGRGVSPRKRVLVVSLSDLVSEVKLESFLAKALQVNGGEITTLTLSWCAWAHQCYRVFGQDRLLCFDRYVPGRIPPEAQAALDQLTTLDDVKAFQFHGVAVGRLALASYLRSYHEGNFNINDASCRARLWPLLGRGVREVIAAERVLDEARPDVILVHDALYVGVGPVFESALRRGIPAVQWIGCQRDDALTLKRFDAETSREHPVSLSKATWAAVQDQPWTAREEEELLTDFRERYEIGRWQTYYNRAYGRLKAAEDVRRELHLDPGKKTAVVFAHIIWDSTLFWGSDLFSDYETWLVETVRAAIANPAVNWVIKFHPQNVWKLRRDGLAPTPMEETVLAQRFGTLPPHIRLLKADADVSTFSLFDVTDYGLTVRGTIGIEMAAYGIPVLTAGTGRFSARGFTIDSATREEFLGRLARIQEFPPLTPAQTTLAKRYAHTLLVRRPCHFDTFQLTCRTLDEVGHPLDHNVDVRAKSAADVVSARDFETFARWVLDDQALDYLAPAAGAVGALHAMNPEGGRT